MIGNQHIYNRATWDHTSFVNANRAIDETHKSCQGVAEDLYRPSPTPQAHGPLDRVPKHTVGQTITITVTITDLHLIGCGWVGNKSQRARERATRARVEAADATRAERDDTLQPAQSF